MAIKLIDREFCPYSGQTKDEYICDTDADFASLPTACTGSTAVSIATGNVRIVNTSGNWVAFGG